MKLQCEHSTNKDMRGRIRSHRAKLADIYADGPSKADAESALTIKVLRRCCEESTQQHIVILHGHIGIFSLTFDGQIETRHIAPLNIENGYAPSGCTISNGTMIDAALSWRMNVAQLTWDGESTETDCFGADSPKEQAEFRNWAEWQRRYSHAVRVLGLSTDQAHHWASTHQAEVNHVL